MNATEEDLVPCEMAVPLEPLIRALQPRAVKDYDFWIVFLCFFLPLMWRKHPKPPSESYPDSNWKSVFSDVSQLCSVCFCFTVAMSSTQFHMKMQASLSRVLQKKSHEVIWAADDIWFVNLSTWIDFDF